jgi:hypothetical protein
MGFRKNVNALIPSSTLIIVAASVLCGLSELMLAWSIFNVFLSAPLAALLSLGVLLFTFFDSFFTFEKLFQHSKDFMSTPDGGSSGQNCNRVGICVLPGHIVMLTFCLVASLALPIFFIHNTLRVRLFLYAHFPHLHMYIPRISNALSVISSSQMVASIYLKVNDFAYKVQRRIRFFVSNSTKDVRFQKVRDLFYEASTSALAIPIAQSAHVSLLKSLRTGFQVFRGMTVLSQVRSYALFAILFIANRELLQKGYDFYSTLNMKKIRDHCFQPWFFVCVLLTMTTALMRGVQTGTPLDCVRAMTFRMTDKLRSFASAPTRGGLLDPWRTQPESGGQCV